MPFFGHGLCGRRAGGFESHALGTKKKGPIAGSLFNQVVGDEGCPRAAGAARAPLRRFAPRVLRWKTLRVSSAPHPCGFESLCDGPKKERPPSLGAFSIKWWAMRGVRVRLAPPAPRFVASLLACCAGKRFAFPQLRTLAGSNPSAMGPKRKGPHRWEPFQSSGGR